MEQVEEKIPLACSPFDKSGAEVITGFADVLTADWLLCFTLMMEEAAEELASEFEPCRGDVSLEGNP